MLITTRNDELAERVVIPDKHPVAKAILILVESYQSEKGETSDHLLDLWDDLTDDHRNLLIVLSEQRNLTQPALERVLGVDNFGLRGILNGIGRIVKRYPISNPVQTRGYNRKNRRYSLKPHVAKLISELVQ